MGYKKEHKQQQARQWHKEFFPLKVQTFFFAFIAKQRSHGFVENLGTKIKND